MRFRRWLNPGDIGVCVTPRGNVVIDWSRSARVEPIVMIVFAPVIMGAVWAVAWWTMPGWISALAAVPATGVVGVFVAIGIQCRNTIKRGPLLVVDAATGLVQSAFRRSLVGRRVVGVVFTRYRVSIQRELANVPSKQDTFGVLVVNSEGQVAEEVLFTVHALGRPPLESRLRQNCEKAGLTFTLVDRAMESPLPEADFGPMGVWDDTDTEKYAGAKGVHKPDRHEPRP